MKYRHSAINRKGSGLYNRQTDLAIFSSPAVNHIGSRKRSQDHKTFIFNTMSGIRVPLHYNIINDMITENAHAGVYRMEKTISTCHFHQCICLTQGVYHYNSKIGLPAMSHCLSTSLSSPVKW